MLCLYKTVGADAGYSVSEIPVEARFQIKVDQLGTASAAAWARSDGGSQVVRHAVCARHISEADKLGQLYFG